MPPRLLSTSFTSYTLPFSTAICNLTIFEHVSDGIHDINLHINALWFGRGCVETGHVGGICSTLVWILRRRDHQKSREEDA